MSETRQRDRQREKETSRGRQTARKQLAAPRWTLRLNLKSHNMAASLVLNMYD